MTIFEITENYYKLMEMMEDPEADQEAINDTLEALDANLEDKADNYAKIIKTWQGEIAVIQQEIERLRNRKNLLDLNIDQLKSNLEHAMKVSGKLKFKTPLFSFGIQKAGAKPLEIDVLPIDLPEEFVEYEIKVDKKGLSDALKLNPEEYGKYCHFGEQKEVLRIR